MLLLCYFTSDNFIKKLIQHPHKLLGHGLKQEKNMPWLVEDNLFTRVRRKAGAPWGDSNQIKGNIWKHCNAGLQTLYRNNLVGFVRAFTPLVVLSFHFVFKRKIIALRLEVGAVASFPIPITFTDQFLPQMVKGFAHFDLSLCFPGMKLKYSCQSHAVSWPSSCDTGLLV